MVKVSIHFPMMWKCSIVTGPFTIIDLSYRTKFHPLPGLSMGGLRVDETVRVIGAERLWAMGSLGKARYWEIIAVPDIRVQAEQVAEAIVREFNDVA